MQKKISCDTLNIGKYASNYIEKHLRWSKLNSAKMKNKKMCYRSIDPPICFFRSSRTSFSATDTVLFLRSAK